MGPMMKFGTASKWSWRMWVAVVAAGISCAFAGVAAGNDAVSTIDNVYRVPASMRADREGSPRFTPPVSGSLEGDQWDATDVEVVHVDASGRNAVGGYLD